MYSHGMIACVLYQLVHSTALEGVIAIRPDVSAVD